MSVRMESVLVQGQVRKLFDTAVGSTFATTTLYLQVDIVNACEPILVT